MDYVGVLGMFLPSAFSFAGGVYIYKLHKRDKEIETAKALREKEHKAVLMEQERENKAIREGLCAVLRDRIIQSATYHERSGHIPLRDMENMTLMYQAYHNLGGNGLVTKVYEEMLKLTHMQKE